MNKMVVLAKAVEGRREELARWYDERHIPDLLAVSGFVRGERLDAMPVKQPPGMPAWDFILIYEIEGNPMEVLGRMGGLLGSEKMPVSSALESSSTLSFVGLSRTLLEAAI